MNSIDLHVGARVRAARFQAGLTLGSVASLIDTNAAQLLLYESGKERIPAKIVNQLCRILNVSPHYLFELPLSSDGPGRRGARDADAHAPATAKAGSPEHLARAEDMVMRQDRLAAIQVDIGERLERLGICLNRWKCDHE